jgi:large subunit ribosomal protein L25
VNPCDPQHELCSFRHDLKDYRSPGLPRQRFRVAAATIDAAMSVRATTSLTVAPREPMGSRQARRLRREGNVLGIVYGGGEDPLSFQVPERELRHALADAGAVMDLTVQGGSTGPVVVKDLVRHPVNGATMHIDLLRVRLDVKIEATVVLELTGIDDAPGTIDGGVLEQITRELTIEALPNDIPDSLTHDVSSMQINDTITLEALQPPSTITLLDDPETTIAILSPPRLQVEGDDEIESETEVVGETAAEGEAADGGEADAPTGGDDSGE